MCSMVSQPATGLGGLGPSFCCCGNWNIHYFYPTQCVPSPLCLYLKDVYHGSLGASVTGTDGNQLHF